MRPIEDLRFIRDRVLADIRANPPRGPLLVEIVREKRLKALCQQSHDDWVQRKGRRRCRECDRQGQRERRGR